MAPPKVDPWEDDSSLTASQCDSLISLSQATSKEGGQLFPSLSSHGDSVTGRPPIVREEPCKSPYLNTSDSLYMVGGTRVPPPSNPNKVKLVYTGSKKVIPYKLAQPKSTAPTDEQRKMAFAATLPKGAYVGSKGVTPYHIVERKKPALETKMDKVDEQELTSKAKTLPKSSSKTGSMFWSPYGLVPSKQQGHAAATVDREGNKENEESDSPSAGCHRPSSNWGECKIKDRDEVQVETVALESRDNHVKTKEAGSGIMASKEELVDCRDSQEESDNPSAGCHRPSSKRGGCMIKVRAKEQVETVALESRDNHVKAQETDWSLSPPYKKQRTSEVEPSGRRHTPSAKDVSCTSDSKDMGACEHGSATSCQSPPAKTVFSSDSEENQSLPSPSYVPLPADSHQLWQNKKSALPLPGSPKEDLSSDDIFSPHSPGYIPLPSDEDDAVQHDTMSAKSPVPLPCSPSKEDLSTNEILDPGPSGSMLPPARTRPVKPLKSIPKAAPVSSSTITPCPKISTKPKQVKRPRPPKNPFGHEIRDKSTGEVLDVDSPEFMKRYSRLNRYNPETEKQMAREFKKFVMYCEEYDAIGPDKVKAMLSSKLPDEQVANFMCKYIQDRFNETHYQKTGEIKSLDTSTMDRVFCQIALSLTDQTDYVILGNPRFNQARATKITYMKDAKEKWQLGGLKGPAESLSRAEINMILSSDCVSTFTPFGLIALLYVQLCLYFLPRVRKELHNLRRGELIPIYNADGSPKCFCYVPMKALKRDQGDVSSTSDRASKVLKRAAALHCPAVKKVDMFHVWEEFCRHLDAIPFDGDRKYQRVFYMPRQARIRKKDTPFFGPRLMGIDAFDRILVETLFMVGIDTGDRKISNQTLRVSACNLHELMGIPEQSTAAQAGHASSKTQRVYKRGDWDAVGLFTGATQVFIHGVPVTKPNTNQVLMMNGKVREPHSFMPEINGKDPSTVYMKTLPITKKQMKLKLDTIPEAELLDKGIIMDEELLSRDDTEEEMENADSCEDQQNRPTKFYHTVKSNGKSKKKRMSC